MIQNTLWTEKPFTCHLDVILVEVQPPHFQFTKGINPEHRYILALSTFQVDYFKQTNSLPGRECSSWTVLELFEFAPWPCLSSTIAIFFLSNALSLHPILMMYYTYTSLKRQFALMMYRHAIYHNAEKPRGKHPGVYNSSSDALCGRTGRWLI